ncbi:MAG: PmoA family protein [Candidatus Latescibacteria bacterium]|jgi:hypothetical protein|nr:PmoA family protein [Candidatus Latescibacterota bacterium]
MANQIEIAGGPHDRRNCPVTAEMPAAIAKKALRVVRMTSENSGVDILGQAVLPEGSDSSAVSCIIPHMLAGETLTLNVEPSDAPQDAGVEMIDDGQGKVKISVDGVHFTTYHYGDDWARPFFHPVVGPYGASVTRGFPVEPRTGEHEDHHHHKSLYVAHGDVNGADNWSEEEGSATVKHLAFESCETGPVFGRFVARNAWLDSKGQTVMHETRTVTIYAVPTALALMDVDVEFEATEGEVSFGDTKEGGILSVRVATPMDASLHGTIVQSTGATNEAETWGKRAAWCDYYGPADDGNEVGIAVMNHPSSFRYPTWWHVRNYGLMTANPFGWGDFYGTPERDGTHVLPEGESLLFRYRVFVHPGSTQAADVGGRFMDYIHSPKASAS